MAGELLVPTGELAAGLGDRAWRTLQALWVVRDKTGRTHATREGLATLEGFAPSSETSVMKDLARLVAAGLVKKIGWEVRKVPDGERIIERNVYVREVRGARALGMEHGLVIVPAETSAWLERAPRWGGRRACAGRPARIQDGSTPPGPGDEFKTGRPPHFCEFKRGRPNSRRVDPPLFGGIQVGSPINKNKREISNPMGVSRLRRETGAPSGAPLPGGSPEPGDAPFLERQGGASASEASPPALAPPGLARAILGAREPAFAGLGSSLGSALVARATASTTTPLEGVPPFPGVSVVAPATIPDPPMLEESMGDLERADLLATAFRGAAESRFGAKCWAFRGGPLLRSKFYALLVVAASTLLDLELAPAAWCAFSCDVWKRSAESHGRKAAKHPPVVWVFNANRIVERRGWFRAEEGSYLGGRVVYGPKHKALLECYARMRLELLAKGEELSSIVKRYFPDWERTIAEVRSEAAEMQQRLRAQVERGDFLW